VKSCGILIRCMISYYSHIVSTQSYILCGHTIHTVYPTTGFRPRKNKQNSWCIPFPGVYANCSNMQQSTPPPPRGCGTPPWGAPKARLACFADIQAVCIYTRKCCIPAIFLFCPGPKTGGCIYIYIWSNSKVSMRPNLSCSNPYLLVSCIQIAQAVALCSNAILIGIQVDVRANSLSNSSKGLFSIVDLVYCALADITVVFVA